MYNTTLKTIFVPGKILVSLNPLIVNNLPGFVFFRELNLKRQYCNSAYAAYLGLPCKEDFMKMTYAQVPNRYVAENADLYDAHDLKTVTLGKKISLLSVDTISQSKPIIMYGCKVPYMDEEGKITGILGQALVIDSKCWKNLYELTHSKFNPGIHSTYEIHDYGNYQLTMREAECYFYLLRGYTAKSIALKLSISHKTVESYLTEVKRKLNCKSKTQLIEKGFDLGLIHIIPNQLMPFLQ